MSQKPSFYFDTISDETLFSVRELAFNDLLNITLDTRPGPAMEALDGRHRFWMHPTEIALAPPSNWNPDRDSDGRVYAMLRVDEANRIISGDLFRDIRRRDWICSWRSEAIFAPANFSEASDWHLLCIAEMFYPNGEDGRHPSPDKMAIMLKSNGKDMLKGCRLAVLSSNVRKRQDFAMTEPEELRPDKHRYRTFRYLTVITLLDENLAKDGLSGLVDVALGRESTAVSDTLAATRSGVFWKNKDGETSENVTFRNVKGETAFEMLAPYQWSDDPRTYVILLTAEALPDKDLYGTALGLDGSALKHKSRFGAVVYVKNIVDNYRKWQEAHGQEVDKDEIARRIRHTYIHELGHLLNLPHPWERNLFLSPPLKADPATKSWMNYGSRYPLGELMVTSRKWKEKIEPGKTERDLEIEDSEKSGAADLRDPGFSGAEHRWFWHAPFNQIATGGEYFTDRGDTPKRLGTPSEVLGKLELKIHDGEVNEDEVYRFRKTPGDLLYLQPFIGEVTFKPRPGLMKEHPFHFTFQSPMLSLLVRAEYPGMKDRNFPRETLEVPVSMLPIIWESTEGPGQLELATALHGHALKSAPDAKGEPTKFFRRTTPLVTPSFLRRFRDKPAHFTVQAVLRPYRSDPIYSRQVRVQFDSGPGRYSSEEEAILSHNRVPLLLELLSYKPETPIETLKLPGQHSSLFDELVFKDLVELIWSVKPGPMSKYIFDYCRDLLHLQMKTEARTFAEAGFKFSIEREIILQFLRSDDELRKKFLVEFPQITT